MNVNEEGNYVAICKECNYEKANKVVMPDWYMFLTDEQKEKLVRYMKYARSYVLANIEDEELIEKIKRLQMQLLKRGIEKENLKKKNQEAC